jgi:glycosyltransferase involved in cell wall biosynthesis
MSKQIAVFHPGTQHSWQTALALQQLDRLAFYATSIFYQPDRWPYRVERYLPALLRERVHAEFRRFSHPQLDTTRVRTFGVEEWIERIAHRLGLRELTRRIDAYGNRRFSASLGHSIASSEPFALWGYDSSSFGAFQVGRKAGRKLILDRTIGDWRAYNSIMDAVYQDYPDFFAQPEYRVSQAKIDRDDAEYTLADVILTGSSFAAETVRCYAADRNAASRVRVLNYNYDEALFANMPTPRPRAAGEPLRFLFLGQAGPRKGIHLVLKAFDRIPASAATLTIVGDLQIPAATFARYADRVDYRATVARADVRALLSEVDVLLFPSYFEGAGIVLYEALAAGVAIIQSRNAAEAVTAETGVMLPDLSEQTLYEAIMTAVDDRERVMRWRTVAQAEAASYSFARYRENIETLLNELGL